MPIYEYKCRSKGHIFEARQGFNEPELTSCEVCQGPVDRLVSASAFHLKGTGWYTTDYKSSGKSTEAKAETSEMAKAEVGGAAKAEPAKETHKVDKPTKVD